MRCGYGISSWDWLSSGYTIAYHVGEKAPAGSTLVITWLGKQFALYHAGGGYPSYAERCRLWEDCQHTWSVCQRQPWFWVQQLPDALARARGLVRKEGSS
jgi:hypothetical protein